MIGKINKSGTLLTDEDVFEKEEDTSFSSNKDWFIDAAIMDTKGNEQPLTTKEISGRRPEEGILWVVLDSKDPESIRWIREESGIDPLVVDVFLNKESSRPRCLIFGNALTLTMRTISKSKSKKSRHSMTTLRIYCEKHCIFILQSSSASDIQLLRKNLRYVSEHITSGIALDEITSFLLDRIVDAVERIEDRVDRLESHVSEKDSPENDAKLISSLSKVRRHLSEIRRYVAPERDALSMLARQTLPWISAEERYQMGETAHRVVRILEDIDNIKERVSISMDEIASQYREQSQQNMYIVSLLATLFMPLSVMTGLWGMNVDAIPFAGHPYGFWLTCLVMFIFTLVVTLIFRFIRLL